ncbi:MAG: SRPBCC family protein [bacterium]|nr:SRPBCC family protein [bacterium]MXZ30723.1 SRPBCC family protein [Acidimicrobiia bacterium]MYJ13892.1 SRPBCC family protein [Acidimicrobiia bacterium]
MRLCIETTIALGRESVWAHLSDIASHAEWMADAVAIEFLSAQRQGAGTRFACETRVGPLRVTDLMEITEWSPPSRMGVRHSGAVSGEGRFELQPAGPSGEHTRMTWSETLRLPWWLGGPLGAAVALPVLRRIWRGNLARLKDRLEQAR